MLVILSGFVLGVITLGHFSAFSSTSVWVFASFTLVFVCAQAALFRLQIAKSWQLLALVCGFMSAFLFGASHAQVRMDAQLSKWQFAKQTLSAEVEVLSISQSVGTRVRQVVRFIPSDKQSELGLSSKHLPYQNPPYNNRFNKNQPSKSLPEKWLITPSSSDNAALIAKLNTMQPSERWRITAHISPPKGVAAAGVFSEARWYLQMGVGASAEVVAAERLDVSPHVDTAKAQLERHRLALRQHIHGLTGEKYAQDKAVLLGLLTGDRSLMDTHTKGLYEHFGISHLLAISGPHVLFAASLAAWLLLRVLGLFAQSYRVLPKRTWVLPLSLLVAIGYALLAGWDIPAQRTVLMFALTTVVLLTNKRLQFWAVLLSAASIMLLADPISVLSAGFWLSFVAVGILLTLGKSKLLAPKQSLSAGALNMSGLPEEQSSWVQKWLDYLRSFALLQVLFFLAILPVTLVFFGRVSYLTPVANLLAIPFLGFIVVPLNILAYLLSHVSIGLADTLWQLLLWLLHGFHALLMWLQGISPKALFGLHLDTASLWFIAFLGGLWLLPTGRFRWLTVPLALALFAPRAMTEPMRATVLDGASSSVVLVQVKDGWRRKNLLYVSDIYPKQHQGYKNYELQRIILPQLVAAQVKRIDTLVLSFSTQELAELAFIKTLQTRFGVTQVYTNADLTSEHVADAANQFDKNTALAPCRDGRKWRWGSAQFTFVSPWADVPVKGDDAACVLHIKLSSKEEENAISPPASPLNLSHDFLGNGSKNASLENNLPNSPLNSLLLMGNASTLNQNMLLALCAKLSADVVMLPKQGSYFDSLDAMLTSAAPRYGFSAAKADSHKPLPSLQSLVVLADKGMVSDALRDTGTLTYRFGVMSDVRQTYRSKAPWLQ